MLLAACTLRATAARPACPIQPRRRAAAAAGALAPGGQEPHQKKTIEELAAAASFGTEEGAAAARLQDLGAKPCAAALPEELTVDASLRAALQPLLLHVRAGLEGRGEGGAAPHAVASAAVAAAEASGALPPLAGPQRAAVESFFCRLAEGLPPSGGPEELPQGGFEKFGSSGGEALYGEEDAVLRIRPHQTEILEAVVNAHLGSGGATRFNRGPEESVKAGGEVGNIALQSDTHGSAPVRGNPAESEADRAERQAEEAFQELELADLPHATAADLAAQREWERHPENKEASAAIEGDAPAAGDGLQVVDSPVEGRQIGGSGEPETSYED